MRTSFRTYSLGFAALVLAVLIRWALEPLMHDSLPLVTVFAAVAAAVWLGGYRVAIPVTLVGYVACHYLFIPPRFTFDLTSTGNQVGFVAYLFTCSLIIVFGETARLAQTRATESREVFRVTLRSIGDAVITTDTRGCVTYINGVAESLTGWSHEDALGQPLESVFRIVNEVTRQPVEIRPRELCVMELLSASRTTPYSLRKTGAHVPSTTVPRPFVMSRATCPDAY